MRKILLAAGEKELSTATLDFACYLANLTRAELTCLFLDAYQMEEFQTEGVAMNGAVGRPMPYTAAVREEVMNAYDEQQTAHFEAACFARELAGTPHSKRGVSWEQLLAECRYADVLIVESDLSPTTLHPNAVPSREVSSLLHRADCPVIIAPQSFVPVDEIVFTCDGSKSSTYAIGQFLYLFPELANKKAIVLQIHRDDESRAEVTQRLKDWLKGYFAAVEFVHLEGNAEDKMLSYLLARHNSFVVMGGFGRSCVSTMLHPSVSAAVAKLLPGPLFIAHQ